MRKSFIGPAALYKDIEIWATGRTSLPVRQTCTAAPNLAHELHWSNGAVSTKIKVGHWANNKPPPSIITPWVRDSVLDSVLEFGDGVGPGVGAPRQKCCQIGATSTGHRSPVSALERNSNYKSYLSRCRTPVRHASAPPCTTSKPQAAAQCG